MTVVGAIRELLDKVLGRGDDLERDVQAAEDARRRGPDVVDPSEGVPPTPYGSGESAGGGLL